MNTKWYALLAGKRLGTIHIVTDADIAEGVVVNVPKQIAEFRARTSDRKLYPVDGLQEIIRNIRNEIERHDVLDFLEVELGRTQFVNLSNKEIEACIDKALKTWGGEYGQAD